MNIHRRIKERREKLGLSMQAVAAAAGVSAWQTVQQWEKEEGEGGTAPKRERLKRVAAVLETTPEYLLFGTSPALVTEAGGARSEESGIARVLIPTAGDDGEMRLANVELPNDRWFLFRIEDGSMAPRYMPGDYALVEPGIEPEIEDDVLVKFSDGKIAVMRLLSRRGGIRLGLWSDPTVRAHTEGEITWMYYVSGFVPSRKVRISG
jgi:transcriptional regulator with XRE-family HTH domain